MRNFTPPLQKITCLLLLFFIVKTGYSQTTTLKIKDFAIWGGSASANSYNSSQGVFIKEKATIQGNIGTNHVIDIKENLTLAGNIFSGNTVSLKDKAKITGNISASKTATNCQGNVISGNKGSDFSGNLTAKGKIVLGTGTGSNITYVRGQVAVPAPSVTNYSGPVPAGGIVNVLTFPVLPSMPNNTSFDSQVGTINITNTQTISPGIYKKLALTGSKTLTFNGPGNYIFYEIDNGTSTNKFVFDFINTTTGIISIYIIKDARWGKLSVKTANGNFPSRIYTEVHGSGSSCGGNAFDLQGPDAMPSGSYAWLGNVWAPNAAISVKNLNPSTIPHIIGALWSGKAVNAEANLVLTYQAPAADPSFIDPYYPPPTTGKVNAPNNIIGAELFSLSQNTTSITAIPDNNIFRFNSAGKVMIEVISNLPNDNILKAQLAALGMTDTIANGPHTYVITGFFPINNLTQLNSNTRIKYVRPLYPPVLNSGQVTTQGDITMRSNFVRDRFGLDGSGVKIGVMSDSYNSKLAAQNDVDQDDLPGIKSNGQPNDNPEPVQVVADLTQGGNDEGRAMLQIVHDVAPKSKLAFRTGFLTAGDFAKGILQLADPTLPGGRCDIIVDDLSYLTEPFLRDGVVAKVVDSVVGQGVTYFSAAGNFGTNSYESVFNGVTNTTLIPSPGQIHKFGNTAADIYQTVDFKPGSYTIVLQWSDEFYSLGSSGVQTDMDLYLVGANGYTLFGFNRSNIFGDPFEVCPFTVKEETNAKIMVVRAAGNTNVRFKYIILRGDATIMDYKTGTSSIVGQSNANGCISVGAMLYANFPQYTPVWPGVASFSSRGGTSTLQNNAFITRNKPDLIGPNGVNTTVNLGGASTFNDGDPYPNFFGTSAAAPHVAAVGGLLIQARKKFNLQTTVTPNEIRQQLVSSAGKFSYLPGNFSFEGGYGYVQADSAVQQIANARPIIDSLKAVTAGAQNGNQPFVVKVKGRYLTSAAQIYANGMPVTTTISADKTEATATVPAIAPGQDPPFQLFNPAKSTSGLDGGLSEALHFFSSRIDVTVKATNKSRKYGQDNPTFTADVFINGIPINQTNITLAALKLDGNNLSLTTIATSSSGAGLYGIFPSRTTPLLNTDPLLSQYGFTFVSGALTVEKMPLKITPQNKQIKYGEYPGDIVYNYELTQSPANSSTLLEEVKALHKKYLADNGLAVISGFNNQSPAITPADLTNMSMMASFQAVRNARKFVLNNGQLQAVVNSIDPSQIGDQRFIVDVAAQSLQNYKTDSSQSNLVQPASTPHARGLLNIKALANGNAKASVPNGQLQPMVNGQLLAMVNGQLQAAVNGQLQAVVNGISITVDDIVFQNGQLLAAVNGVWTAVTSGQLLAVVNGQQVTVNLSVVNGQLQAVVNGQPMVLVNGQLQAVVNGQLLAVVNGQLKAAVNGQLMPMVNGQLMAMVNGQLQAMVNGQLLAVVNGQLMAVVNGELQIVQDLILSNGQLQAVVNGQLQAVVNGQLKAMVNGVVTDIPTTGFSLVNGQLQAVVNGQLLAMVNGQLLAVVNGQLQPMVNGAAVAVESVRQLVNGQLQAAVNGIYIPIKNGQLQAVVNGQLLAMVNGQLMAVVNGELAFAVFRNGQLQAVVNGQLQAVVNGQLLAVVNGQLQTVNSYSIVNGQLQAVVNNQTWVYSNGQLLAVVNGQLQPLVNNFDVSGTSNNSKTVVLVDEDDINLQSGDVGGMFSVNMITGLNAGTQTLIPGAFVNENFEVTYGLGQVTILPAPLTAKAKDTTKVYGDANPAFSISYSGFAYNENESNVTPPVATTTATNNTGVGAYPITLTGGSSGSANYSLTTSLGTLTIGSKTLHVTADYKTKSPGDLNPPLTITYNGLVGDDTKDSLCIPFVIPGLPKDILQLNRITTYTNVKLNNGTNSINATPGQSITITGDYSSVYYDPTNYCLGCITQTHIGMTNGNGGNLFNQCFPTNNGSSTPNTGSINITFNAPAAPGAYYITQESTWWYYCGQFADPVHANNRNYAIAIVIVNYPDFPNQGITAGTTADLTSPPGNYPITLQGCNSSNPNYNVVLHEGTLTVGYSCNITGHVWKGDGNFDDESGTANGTPVGGVTANGTGLIGSNSFSFDGSSGYISAGTAGSVAGTGDFSVSAWVKTTSNDPMVIINQRGSDNGNYPSGFDGEYILKIGGDHTQAAQNSNAGKAYFIAYDVATGGADLFSNTLVNDGNWHIIKGQRVGTTLYLYVDGVVQDSANSAGVVFFNTAIPTYIGADFRDNASFFNGLIDDIRVSICPSESSRQANRSAPVTKSKSTPAATNTNSASPATKSNSLAVTETNEKPGADKLYPNPASTILRLQLRDDVASVKDILVYDGVGNRPPVSVRKVGNGFYEMNVGALAGGVYIIQVKTTEGLKIFKFIKM